MLQKCTYQSLTYLSWNYPKFLTKLNQQKNKPVMFAIMNIYREYEFLDKSYFYSLIVFSFSKQYVISLIDFVLK